MGITRRESIKAIASLLGVPILLRGEAMAEEKFKFSEKLSGRIAEDSYQTDIYPPRRARAIYDFERGEEKGRSEVNFSGSINIDDLDGFEKDPVHAARFVGELSYNGETFPINGGKVKLFAPPYQDYDKQVRYLVYLLPFSTTKGQYVLSGYKKVKILNLNPADFVKDMATLYTHLHWGSLEGSLNSPQLGPMLGSGILRFDIKDILDLLQSCDPPLPSLSSLKFFIIIAGDAVRSILAPL